jgi:hypothetical protein
MTPRRHCIADRLTSYYRLIKVLAKARSSFDVALPLLPILAKLGLALPAAYLIHKTIRPLTGGPAPYHVLVIEKAVFVEDVLEVLCDAKDIQAFGVRRAVLKSLALGILPRAICGDDAYITDDPAAARAKQHYRRLWKKIWRYMSMVSKYDAVLTGNWCYWAERELASELEAIGTPFVVLHKEGIKPPERSKMLRELFRKERGQFTGRRVLVYHESERDHQIEGYIARPDQITIVGMPRLDRNHKWRRLAAAGSVPLRAPRPTVLLLAFLPNNFLPSYSGIDSDLAWDELCRGTYRAAILLAEKNPGYDVIVRPRIHERDEVEALLDREAKRPKNLRIVTDGAVAPLLEASWVVCGHNTTVLLEALAVNKPVVVPHFGEALDPRYHGFNVELHDAVEHAGSVQDLVNRIERHCQSPREISEQLGPAALDALAKWAGNADGKSGERVRQALMQELSSFGQPSRPA